MKPEVDVAAERVVGAVTHLHELKLMRIDDGGGMLPAKGRVWSLIANHAPVAEKSQPCAS